MKPCTNKLRKTWTQKKGSTLYAHGSLQYGSMWSFYTEEEIKKFDFLKGDTVVKVLVLDNLVVK